MGHVTQTKNLPWRLDGEHTFFILMGAKCLLINNKFKNSYSRLNIFYPQNITHFEQKYKIISKFVHDCDEVKEMKSLLHQAMF